MFTRWFLLSALVLFSLTAIGDLDSQTFANRDQTVLGTAIPSVPKTPEKIGVLDVAQDGSADGASLERWRWGTSGTTATWALETIRVPQLWNLNGAAQHQGNQVSVGVLDAGFQDEDGDGRNDHPDLARVQTEAFDHTDGLQAGAVRNGHGQHVTGIIGATFDNGRGIDGINPSAEIAAVSPQIPDHKSDLEPSWNLMLDALETLLNEHSEIRVVNLSLSYNWALNGYLQIDPNVDAEAQALARRQGLRMRQLAARHPDVLFVAAAGNDSRNRYGFTHEIQAKWASPLNWAALGPPTDGWSRSPNILVIESFDPLKPNESVYRRSDFSNVGGHLAAPGGGILSTVLDGGYDVQEGTSMAAPHVSGLASYLWALDPALTVAEIKGLLSETSRPVQNEAAGHRGPKGETAAPRVDAFAAALAIDDLRAGNPVQRTLVDVDDCTLDGTLRLNRDGRVVTKLCADGRRGDGNVDMADFRAFRDALLTAEGKAEHLDGPSNHAKRDLNGDGCVHGVSSDECPYAENHYPRFDFNGDGRLQRTAEAFFKEEPKTDLEVLMDVWGKGPKAETEGWQAEDLPRILASADLHLDLSDLFAKSDRNRLNVAISTAPDRVVTAEAPKLTITVPADDPVRIHALSPSAADTGLERCAGIEPLFPGEDRWIELRECDASSHLTSQTR